MIPGHDLVEKGQAAAVRVRNRWRTVLLLRLSWQVVRLLLLGRVVFKVRVEPLLEDEVLLPVFLSDGGQGVDVLLEPLPGRLLLGRVGQPGLEVLDQFVVCDAAVLGQHVLADGLEGELCGAGHGEEKIVYCLFLLVSLDPELLPSLRAHGLIEVVS